jgi:hypothetical protein
MSEDRSTRVDRARQALEERDGEPGDPPGNRRRVQRGETAEHERAVRDERRRQED